MSHIENCWTSGGTMRLNVNKSDHPQVKAGGRSVKATTWILPDVPMPAI